MSFSHELYRQGLTSCPFVKELSTKCPFFKTQIEQCPFLSNVAASKELEITNEAILVETPSEPSN